MKKTYIATRAIYAALLNGRHLSQMDTREFMVADMRTIVSHLRKDFEGTHILHTKWIRTPVRNARIKEYWLEER